MYSQTINTFALAELADRVLYDHNHLIRNKLVQKSSCTIVQISVMCIRNVKSGIYIVYQCNNTHTSVVYLIFVQ